MERARRSGERRNLGLQMNLRQIWTELFQKPAGRLILFLLAGAIFLAFFLGRRTPWPKPDNRAVSQQATSAKAYSFEENIPATTRSSPPPQVPHAPETPQRAAAALKPPPPIPQAIFVTREAGRSDSYLPYGRLLRCELVNTVDSSNISTPIIGLVLEDVWHDGRLIIPAGTEVHGAAQKAATRERIGSDQQWMLVFQAGRELPVSGSVLDYAPDKDHPDQWGETDGSAGLRGYMVQADKFGEAKAMLAAMISAAAGAFPQTTNLISPLTGTTTQIQNGGFQDAFATGIQAGGQLYSKRLLDQLDKEPYYVRVPAGTLFYLYVTQTVDLENLSVATSTDPAK
jgi:hypothetical protein